MTEDKFTIRLFTPDDLLDVSAVEKAVYGSGGYRPLFFRQIYDLAPTLQWVAEADARLVAYLSGAIAQDGTTGWILNLAVLAIYRRQGIGHRLLQVGRDQLLAAGASCVKITVEEDNRAAARLYDRLGFKQIGLGKNYYGDGYDRLIFIYEPEE